MVNISVIIPTYNRAAVLKDALDSVLNQTYSNYEIIVVDDGSTDNTDDVVKACQEKENGHKIRYIKQQNGGVACARNAGIKIAEGKYICFLDSDDVYLPDSMEHRMKAVKTYDVEYVVGNPRYLRHKKDSHGYTRRFLPGCEHLVIEHKDNVYCCDANKYQEHIIRHGIFGNVETMTLTKDLLLKVGMFDEGWYVEDVALWHKVCYSIDKFVYIDEVMSICHDYDREGESRITSDIAKHYASERKRYVRYIKMLNENGVDRKLVSIAKRRICARKYKVRGILAYRNGRSIKAIKNYLKARAIWKSEKDIGNLILKACIPVSIRGIFKK